MRPQKNTDTNTKDLLLLEAVLSRDNLFKALERVERNKGAAGVDGLKIEDFRPYLKENWTEIRRKILVGEYKPLPVKQVEIPKSSGGTRRLGVPCLLDRLIQQALLQILSPIFDPGFSRFSFGFRPGRSAHQAIQQAHVFLKSGYSVVVDIDLENFFNEVNHDILMNRVARKVADPRVLKLIRAYLNSGIMAGGMVVANEKGTPQGSPMSPLLSNILLDDLDQELEKRGHRFCRYADDQNVYVKTERAGQRVFDSITRFLETELKLKVNLKKSAVAPAWKRKFLGYSFLGVRTPRVRVANESWRQFKQRIRKLTRGHRSQPMESRIQQLNQYTVGWMNYFKLTETSRLLDDVDGWIRTRLRMCLFKQWRKPRTAVRKLKQLGIKDEHLGPFLSAKKYWYKANISYAKWSLGNQYWQSLGYLSLKDTWKKCQKVT